jgi:hypothetical protein
MAAPQKRGRLEGVEQRIDGAQKVMQKIEALNKTYEDTDFTLAKSPAILDFNGDMDYNAIQGWITCDGKLQTDGTTTGDMIVSFSRDGIIYGDTWTMRAGENINLMGWDVATIKITHSGEDSAYRVVLI